MLENLLKPFRRAKPSSAEEDQGPIIGHDGEWSKDSRLLRMVVESIFRQSPLEGELAKLFEHLDVKREDLADHDRLCGAVEGWIRQNGRLSEMESKRLLEALRAHREVYQANELAYKPEAKPNWRACFYPDGSAPPPHGRSLYDHEELPYARTYGFVTKQTPIGSAGSCFAAEIRTILVKEGYHYVVTEPNERASAAWGALYNIPSMRQLVEKAFGLAGTPRLVAVKNHMKSDYTATFNVVDPFRQSVHFGSIKEYEENYDRHLAAAREAFMRCEVFILTLGMNEIWYLKSNGAILTRMLWDLSPALFDRKTLTVQENIDELNQMLTVWRRHNPNIKLVVTVSPVPLHATFQAEHTHVVAATCHAKCTLRVAAEEFARQNEGVYYFPAYETVMYCTEKPFQADNRHVTPEAVANVERLFKKMFVRPE
jgi:hypothetical protein